MQMSVLEYSCRLTA